MYKKFASYYLFVFPPQTIRQENRITLILIVVVIVFLICQMPTALVLIYTSIHLAEPGSAEFNILLGLGNIFNLLVAINASCNFLLYTALSDKYRKYFCAFFFCRRRRRAPPNPRQFNGNPYELDTMDTTIRYALEPIHTIINNKTWQKGKPNHANNRVVRSNQTKNNVVLGRRVTNHTKNHDVDDDDSLQEVSSIDVPIIPGCGQDGNIAGDNKIMGDSYC